MNTSFPLSTGQRLNINDECVGVIEIEEPDRIFIRSEAFTGWALKSEILDAIERPA